MLGSNTKNKEKNIKTQISTGMLLKCQNDVNIQAKEKYSSDENVILRTGGPRSTQIYTHTIKTRSKENYNFGLKGEVV